MSLFNKIFGSENHLLPSTIDMHSHILPGIDDGAKTVEDSIDMILGLKSIGYSRFICTPHIMGDYYRNDSSSIQTSFDLLMSELKKREIDASVSFAAEYYLDEWFSEKLKRNENFLCLKGKQILVETSYINKPSNFREILFELQMQGYQVVLAHPERYSYLYHSFNMLEELSGFGVKLQLNLNSISGHYGPMAQKYAEKMIDAGVVDFIGTDCHHIRHVEMLKLLMKNKYFGKLSELNLMNNSLVE